jgi:hypothetical protein
MTDPKTPQQLKTIEDLTSKLDNLETTHDFDDALIFSGESADGPCVGSIDPDGKIYWITGEVDV